MSYTILHPSIFFVAIQYLHNMCLFYFLLGSFEKKNVPESYDFSFMRVNTFWLAWEKLTLYVYILYFFSQFLVCLSCFLGNETIYLLIKIGNTTRAKSGTAEDFWRESISKIFNFLCWERIWQIQTDSWGISWNCRLAKMHKPLPNRYWLLNHELKHVNRGAGAMG